jgi:glycosyltransferase involved in cell wall biosynthesis
LQAHGGSIKVYRQSNQGAACARNALCRHATGDFIAFLDGDDVWNSSYLQVHHDLLMSNESAIASFTAFVDSMQFNEELWDAPGWADGALIEVLQPTDFFEQYNSYPNRFIPSTCCVSRKVVCEMEPEPFPREFRGAEDFWFMNMLPLCGRPVMYSKAKLVMYRLSAGSLSADRIRIMKHTVALCERIALRYRSEATPELLRASSKQFPSLRRNLSKYLMGAGKVAEARSQIVESIRETVSLTSRIKSLGLMMISYCPAALQPRWPASQPHEGMK